jgi:hypothetical protein
LKTISSAAGRGEYVPIADNSTTDSKAANRRICIVILPQMEILPIARKRQKGIAKGKSTFLQKRVADSW